jgi:hypothetical protein
MKNPEISTKEFEPESNIDLQFLTHDNGGRPFFIQIKKTNKCTIYKAKYDESDYNKDPTYKEKVWQGSFIHFFVDLIKNMVCMVQTVYFY